MRVFLYGFHSSDWMTALAPEAETWKQLPQVESVIHLEAGEKPQDYLCQNYENVVLIPLMEQHRYTMPTGFRSLTSSVETVQTLSNKRLFACAMKDAGYAAYIPEIWYEENTFNFPILIKREDLNAGIGVSRLESFQDLSRIKQDPMFTGGNYFFQKQILGEDEFVSHIVAKNGSVLLSYTFCYSMEKESAIRSLGNYKEIRPVKSPEYVNAIFAEIIRLFDYSGPCNINFKIQNGVPMIFEINPRLGGSLMMNQNLPFLIDVLGAIIDHAD